MSDRPCHTPGCTGIGYHPASHPHPLKWCLSCLVSRKRERRHAGQVVHRDPFRVRVAEPPVPKLRGACATVQADPNDPGYQIKPATVCPGSSGRMGFFPDGNRRVQNSR